MDVSKTKDKLRKQTDADLATLLKLIEAELEERPKFKSTRPHATHSAAAEFTNFFRGAWIH